MSWFDRWLIGAAGLAVSSMLAVVGGVAGLLAVWIAAAVLAGLSTVWVVYVQLPAQKRRWPD